MNTQEQVIEKWYHTKDTFTKDEKYEINKLIDSYELCTSDIMGFVMYYIYNKLESDYPNKWDVEEICRYTDENISNGLSGKENYDNLLEYLHRLEDDKLEDLPF
jgi:hypothetical protein